MADLTGAQLPARHLTRLPGLELGDGFVLPDYGGHAILNLPASVCGWLGAPPLANAPLAADAAPPPAAEVRRVICLLVDGLALHRLREWIAAGAAPILADLIGRGRLAPLTSITPSTTAAALTTLWTGQAAAVHGVTGYEMWLREYGMVVNTILHAPMSFGGDVGGLRRAGFRPQEFLSLPTLGPHLRAHGVTPYAFQPRGISNSGLSQMILREVDTRAYFTPSDLWLNLRSLLEHSRDPRQYIYVYWPEIDTFSHHYSPDDERTLAEFQHFAHGLEALLARLTPAARRSTRIVLTADHGHVLTQPEARYDLANHPELLQRLHMQPTGENRLAFLYLRPGQEAAVQAYFERAWPGEFLLIPSAQAAAAGLFGPGAPHPGLADRVGDWVALARGHAYLWWAGKENHLIGRHGGLHPHEILVPLLTADLD